MSKSDLIAEIEALLATPSKYGAYDAAVRDCIALIRKHQAEQQGDGITTETVRSALNKINLGVSAEDVKGISAKISPHLRPADPVDLEVCALALENDTRYEPIDMDTFRGCASYSSRLGNAKAVLTAANVKVKE